MKKILVFCLLLASCSDKYKSIADAAPKPQMTLSKDVLTIREKDYTNIKGSNKGKLSVYASDASHQLNIQFSCSNPNVHFTYRGSEIKSGQALIVMDSVNLFCYADTAGVYSVDFYLTDQLGKTTQKQLIINALANKAATPAFFYNLVEYTPQNWHYYFDGSISQDEDGIIQNYHYSVDGQWIITTQPVVHWNFHARGTHDIALYVTDDLGLDSDTIHKQIVAQ